MKWVVFGTLTMYYMPRIFQWDKHNIRETMKKYLAYILLAVLAGISLYSDEKTVSGFKEYKLLHIEYARNILAWEGFEPWRLIYLSAGLIIAIVVAKAVVWIMEKQLSARFRNRNFHKASQFFHALGLPLATLSFAFILFLSTIPMLSCLPKDATAVIERISLAIAAAIIAWGLMRLVSLVDSLMTEYFAEKHIVTNMDQVVIDLVRRVIRLCLFIVAAFFICENILGLHITTLLAGAGVAGIAVAFAAQDTIANFFGSIMIILDRPFKVGDFIRVDGQEGTVEKVGLRSTKLRTLEGHAITVPNKTTANASIADVTMRPYIKKTVDLGLVYDTPPEKMERAMQILHEIFDNHEGMKPDFPPRIYFSDFKDYSLNIQLVVWYHPGDYWRAVEWWNRKNMEILRRFNAEGLEFAFPTQTSYLACDPKRKLEVNIAQPGNNRP